MTESGASFAIAVSDWLNLPPPCEQNGTIVLPVKSYYSRNDATGIGMDAHQFGYPSRMMSYSLKLLM